MKLAVVLSFASGFSSTELEVKGEKRGERNGFCTCSSNFHHGRHTNDLCLISLKRTFMPHLSAPFRPLVGCVLPTFSSRLFFSHPSTLDICSQGEKHSFRSKWRAK